MGKKKFSLKAELRKLSKGKRPSAADRKRFAELVGSEVGGQQPGTWPQTSLALAVHSTQVAEANDKLKAAGLSAYHLPDGRMVVPDAGERKKVLKFKRYVDHESFS